MDTVTSKQKLHTLGEFFPSVAMDVRRDVLAAANYREDVAAAMLGDITRETVTVATAGWMLENTELLFEDSHDETFDLAEVEDWSEVSAADHDTGAWVVVQDNWEIVDKDGEKVRTFADVLRSTPILKAATELFEVIETCHREAHAIS